jgi:FkbM family methyltransferase
MFASAYQRFRMAWRANRAARRARRLAFGELEIPLFEFIVPRRTSIDVGANKGAISYRLLKYSRAVVAFEANPDLSKKLTLALGSRARVVNKAVSNTRGVKTFYIPRGRDGALQPNVGSLIHATQYDCEWQMLQVEATTIDDEQIADVGFIKIDTEGTELDVISGALKTIAEYRPTLMVEINDKTTRESLELQALMTTLGYSIMELADGKIRMAATLADCANRNVFFTPIADARSATAPRTAREKTPALS